MLEHLTQKTFKEKVMNFDTNTDWKFEGNIPAIIKFTASWCSPCKALSPILLELSTEYDKKINIYEVDVDDESELSAKFGIRSVPTMMFCPLEGKPTMTTGMKPKQTIISTIDSVFNF